MRHSPVGDVVSGGHLFYPIYCLLAGKTMTNHPCRHNIRVMSSYQNIFELHIAFINYNRCFYFERLFCCSFNTVFWLQTERVVSGVAPSSRIIFVGKCSVLLSKTCTVHVDPTCILSHALGIFLSIYRFRTISLFIVEAANVLGYSTAESNKRACLHALLHNPKTCIIIVSERDKQQDWNACVGSIAKVHEW